MDKRRVGNVNMCLTNLVIWMTENCNLNCDYCYEKHHPQGFVAKQSSLEHNYFGRGR